MTCSWTTGADIGAGNPYFLVWWATAGAALKMFELGKLSSGKAAELAGLSRVAFFEMCGRYRVSIVNYPPEDLDAELEADLKAVRSASS